MVYLAYLLRISSDSVLSSTEGNTMNWVSYEDALIIK